MRDFFTQMAVCISPEQPFPIQITIRPLSDRLSASDLASCEFIINWDQENDGIFYERVRDMDHVIFRLLFSRWRNISYIDTVLFSRQRRRDIVFVHVRPSFRPSGAITKSPLNRIS